MILFLVVLAIFKHKSTQAEREYKRIQLQMDTLENSVRSECKQAFAELQTDMTDLNNDLQTTGHSDPRPQGIYYQSLLSGITR